MRIWFDRSLATGRYLFAVIMALAILCVPTIAYFSHDIFLSVLSHDFVKDDSMDDVMSLYECYLNPNFGNNYGSERGYQLIIAYVGAFLLNGILVSFFVSFIQNRRERWEKGTLHYGGCTLGKFCVIIGGNEMVPNLIKQLLEDKNRNLNYVLLMTNRDVPQIRKSLVSKLGEAEEKVVIYYGERTSKDDLKLLKLHNSEEIYIIGEQLDILQSGSHHDVKNMECVNLVSSILINNPKYFDAQNDILKMKKKPCRVMFEYQSTFSVFQFTDINIEISKVLDFRPFNYYETWAQKVLVSTTISPSENDRYLPLEGLEPITADSLDTVHLIIVGMSRMGIAMGVEAAHVAHYPNFSHCKTKPLRTRITFIDTKAKQEMQYVQGHYKELFALSRWRYMEAGDDSIYYNVKGHIPYDANDKSWKNPLSDKDSHSPYHDQIDYSLGKNIVDVDWEFIQGNLEMPTVQYYIRNAAKQENVRLTIAICFPKDNQSFAGSLYLPDEVYEENNNVVQVLAYQPFGDAMCQCFMRRVEMVGNVPSVQHNVFNQFGKLRAFGMMNSCYDIEYQKMTEEAAGKLNHQYQNTNRDIYDQKVKYGAIFDIKSNLKAGKSLAAQQWSNAYAAAHLWTKLRSIKWDSGNGTLSNNVSILAQTEHMRWNMEQLLMGYAPLKPEEQQSIKDILKCLVVPVKELEQLSELKDENINPNQFPKVKEWLTNWKKFDERKAILKAEMSHLDICSCEKLKELDPEAFKYDENLTQVLPEIYTEIKKIKEKN